MSPHRTAVSYRPMRVDDIPQLLTLEAASFPGIPVDRYWQPDMLQAHVDRFPAGQFVAEIDGKVIGSATSLRLPLETALRHHTWREITGSGYLTTHRDDGDALYGTEIMVHPDARRRGIGRALYRLRKDLIRKENIRAMITGGRIPGYYKHADKMTASIYVSKVTEGLLTDRTLNAQLGSGMTVAGVMPGYITDPHSHNHATLLVWWNLEYQDPRRPRPAPGTTPPGAAMPHDHEQNGAPGS